MRARFLTLAVAGASLLLAAGAPQEKDKGAKKTDKDLIQGTWTAVSGEAEGEDLGEDMVKQAGITLTVKDDKYTFKSVKSEEDGTLKLDPAKKPKELDIMILSGP